MGEGKTPSPYLSLPQEAFEITKPTLDKGIVGAYFLANAADLYTTYRVLDAGGYEMNPLLTVAGEDKWTVVATGAALKTGYFFLVRKLYRTGKIKRKHSNWLLGTATVMDAAISIHNTGEY